MKKIFIIKYGEIALKGLNKPYFEKKLMTRIKKVLKDIEILDLYRSDGILYLEVSQDEAENRIINLVRKVFGIAYISIAIEVKTDMDEIVQEALAYTQRLLQEKPYESFKVVTKRGNKRFPLTSPEISSQIGGYIYKHIENMKVDIHNPDLVIYLDIRNEKSYIYHEKIQGYGGLPLGTNGKGVLLLSGGIDSPVAGWMMAKRGMELEAVHFHSYPYTSDRAREKVLDLAGILAEYCNRIRVTVINLLDIQQAILEKCPEEQSTILSRRFMMRIAERIGRENGSQALITGESIGQVASQTIEGLVVTNQSVSMPVMRPLIAMDKIDIMELAKDIGTYDTSILPYEDCCTVFLPKHPVTKPKLEDILAFESLLDVEGLIENALSNQETVLIKG